MNTRIKICGFTRPEDARTAAGLGADALGLVFYPGSKRHIGIDTARDIAAVLPPFASIVALFVNAEAAHVREVLTQVPVDMLQFHGDEPPAFCRQFERPYLKAVRVRGADDIVQAAARYADARALLLDAHVADEYGGTGRAFDWSVLPDSLAVSWILSGGLHAGNVAAALRQTGARTVDVSSGVESAPGIKCPHKMREFIRQVRRFDAAAAGGVGR
ncbi:MAG: phosphoribosylanthranilate isomerase [Eikenella sp.]|nr:phosphoribosylanthranilate isomerase [Eikenella sp.]